MSLWEVGQEEGALERKLGPSPRDWMANVAGGGELLISAA